MSSFFDTIENKFPTKKIVIAGDLVADQFLRGTIARVSREAPVFILRHDETETLAGGAANAAVNVSTLGGAAFLVGLTGNDPAGRMLLENLENSGVRCDFAVASDEFKTTTKVRVLAGQHYAPRQQVIRIDYENDAEIPSALIEKLKQNLIAAATDADALIISDYNYGVANDEIFNTAREISQTRQIPLLIDSRFRLENFPHATSATPNQEEVETLLGEKFNHENCAALCRRLGLESLLVTCGNKGMTLIENGKEPFVIEAIGAKEPVDVTGAGDTVIAVYALALACGLSFADSAVLANHAGGIVVMKKGTAAVTPAELRASLETQDAFERKTQTI